jgi:hypothetical protein
MYRTVTTIVCLFFLGLTTIFVAYDQAAIAYKSHVIPPPYDSSIDGVLNAYAKQMSSIVPEGKPLVVLVPLNGYPDKQTHPSYRNGIVVMEILKRVTNHPKYLILSEGYTGKVCKSGALATAEMLGLMPGYNNNTDITVFLENHATTTLENITNSKPILKREFAQKDVYLIVAGMSDMYPLSHIDIGHGARAFMFAKQNYGDLPFVHTTALLPTNMVDWSVGGYFHEYNLITMYLGANGILNLPVFDKKYEQKHLPGCVEYP